MLSKVSEKTFHKIRWVLVISWLLLILSLFIDDPFTLNLTDPNFQFFSPLKDQILLQTNDPSTCVKVQGKCLNQNPYYPGARIFWAMIIPSGIFIVLTFGHEFWRRICPLYFFSQIPRALGLQPKLNIEDNNWLRKNHLYLQFSLFFIGLNFRILFVNSDRRFLGAFLLLTIISAAIVVFLYGGRSWCHYVCPFGMVQTVFTGTRGLLGSEASKLPPGNITQSMCRTIDSSGQEISACINCKSPCMDIDSEKAYWEQLKMPGRKLVQYGYLGLVIGYFVYYPLYSGNFWYYFSGAWTHEKEQLAAILKPGFYFFGTQIPIPKLIATPLTLAFFAWLLFVICQNIEKTLFSHTRKKNPDINRELIQHRVFSMCTFISFNAFFVYGGRPEILRLPFPLQLVFQGIVVLVSSIWFYRTWGRSNEQYKKETTANTLRRQLEKLSKKHNLDFSQFMEGRSLDKLTPDELYILAKIVPGITAKNILEIYKGVLTEMIEAGNISTFNSLEVLQPLRQQLNITDQEHQQLLQELFSEKQKNRLEIYQKFLQDMLEIGKKITAPNNLKAIQNLRQQLAITEEEHDKILQDLQAIMVDSNANTSNDSPHNIQNEITLIVPINHNPAFSPTDLDHSNQNKSADPRTSIDYSKQNKSADPRTSIDYSKQNKSADPRTSIDHSKQNKSADPRTTK